MDFDGQQNPAEQGGITFSAERDDNDTTPRNSYDNSTLEMVENPDTLESETYQADPEVVVSYDDPAPEDVSYIQQEVHADNSPAEGQVRTYVTTLEDPDEQIDEDEQNDLNNVHVTTVTTEYSNNTDEAVPTTDDYMDINGTSLPHPEINTTEETEDNARNQQRSGYLVQSGDYEYASPVVTVDIPDQDPGYVENEIITTVPEHVEREHVVVVDMNGNAEASNGIHTTHAAPDQHNAEASTSQHAAARKDESLPGYTSIDSHPAYEMQSMSTVTVHNGMSSQNPDKKGKEGFKKEMMESDEAKYYFEAYSPSNMTAYFAFAAIVFFLINLPCGLIALCCIRKARKAETEAQSRKYGVFGVGFGLIGVFVTAAIIGAMLGLHYSGDLYD